MMRNRSFFRNRTGFVVRTAVVDVLGIAVYIAFVILLTYLLYGWSSRYALNLIYVYAVLFITVIIVDVRQGAYHYTFKADGIHIPGFGLGPKVWQHNNFISYADIWSLNVTLACSDTDKDKPPDAVKWRTPKTYLMFIMNDGRQEWILIHDFSDDTIASMVQETGLRMTCAGNGNVLPAPEYIVSMVQQCRGYLRNKV